LDGFYKKRPSDFREIVCRPVRFSKFFPLVQAVNKEIFKVVSNEGVPENLGAFPIFRSNPNPKAKSVDDGWWLWDGKKGWRVGILSNNQRKYPKRSIVNDTALIEMIEGKWGPDTEI
jgi:hypothetical protein